MSVDVDRTYTSPSVRCAGCDRPFSAGDIVMPVHLSVFHSSCFSCCICRRRLSRGQHFALVDAGLIYCRADYERRHAGTAVRDAVAVAAEGEDARCLVLGGNCDELPYDDGVHPAAKTDDEALSASNFSPRTLCRGSQRTRKLTPSSLYRNAGQNK